MQNDSDNTQSMDQASAPLGKPHATRLHCPYCRIEIEVGELPSEEVTCPMCGSTFRVESEPSTATWTAGSLPVLGKFKLIARIGQGGFGTVFRAWDTTLERFVAVKIPRIDRSTNPESEERFEREARAAAALDYKGIVRVFEFGRSDDCPYIVSEFVEGISLADALTGRRFSFRESAEIAADVAEALDHAHQKKVIHRDVKPSNIMLTANREACAQEPSSGTASPRSGDTLHWQARLMDFGLARQQDDEVRVTVEGQVLGTYAYFSPEQARGEGHLADGRTDVYSLGVVLYEMLVGETPFRGNRNMLRHQVLCEEPRSPRKLNDRIPRDLETIALKCLAKEPDRRYRTAGEAAADLRRWLAGEPIHARPVRATERIRLWCRRRPAIAGLVAALAITLLAGFAGVTSQWLRAERSQREATRHLKESRRAVDTFLTDMSDSLRYYPGVQKARERLLQQAAAEYERFANEHSNDPGVQSEFGKAFVRLGDVRMTLNEFEAAELAYRSAHRVFDDLARAHPSVLDYRLERANSRIKLGIALHETDRSEPAEHEYQTARGELEALAESAPQSDACRDALGTCLLNLSLLCHADGRYADAEAAISDAIEQFENLVQSSANDKQFSSDVRRQRFALASTRNVRGVLLTARGRNAEAADVLRQAVDDFETLGGADPDHPDYIQGRADSRINLANAQRTLGRDEEGLKAYRAAIGDYRDLLKAIPDVPAYREDLGRALINAGQLLHKMDRNPEAKQLLDEALATLTGLLEEYPLLGRYHKNQALAQASLAQTVRDLGDDEQAEALLRSALEITQMLAGYDANPEHRELAAVYRSNLAGVLHQHGRHDQALVEFEAAIAESKRLSEADPAALHYRDALAWSYSHRGDLLRDLDREDEAADDYRQVLALRRRLVQDSPDPEYRCQLAWFLSNCPDESQRDPAMAIQLAQQAVDAAPDSAAYWNALGAARYRAGQWQAAIDALNQAQSRRPEGHCLDWFFLAMAYRQVGEHEKASTTYEQGILWMDASCPHTVVAHRLVTEINDNMLHP